MKYKLFAILSIIACIIFVPKLSATPKKESFDFIELLFDDLYVETNIYDNQNYYKNIDNGETIYDFLNIKHERLSNLKYYKDNHVESNYLTITFYEKKIKHDDFIIHIYDSSDDNFSQINHNTYSNIYALEMTNDNLTLYTYDKHSEKIETTTFNLFDTWYAVYFEYIPVVPVKERPAISGQDSLINNIDAPYTLEQIKTISNLKALDPYYGDLSSSIVIIKDDYSQNKSSIGAYTITYQVTNPANLTTDYILTLINTDQTAPIITGPATSKISYQTTLSNQDIISKYQVYDNVDTQIRLLVEHTDYIPNRIGTFTFMLKAIDTFGNISKVSHTVNVVDDILPVINDEQKAPIQLDYKTIPTASSLLSGITAHDEIDGTITDKIIIVSNELITGKIGTYHVVYSVSDHAGNTTTYTRNYEIITQDYPIFYISSNILMIEDAHALTIEQIIKYIASIEKIDIETFVITKDNYSKNKHTPGIYDIEFEIITTNDEMIKGQKQIKVFRIEDNINEPSPKSISQHLNAYWYYYILGFICLIVIIIYFIKKKTVK